MTTRIKNALRDPGVAVMFGLNRLYRVSGAGPKRPVFHDIDKIKPELRRLDQNFETIRREMEGVLANAHQIPKYHEIAPRETYISGTVDTDKAWRVFMLRSPLGRPVSNQERCPETTKLVHEIPGVFQAFFSILEPGKSIPAHCGDYLGYLRYHLALRVPANKPPSIRIKDQHHTWVERESVIFDDSWEHEVYNQSEDIRVVLIVDFLRPMTPIADAANWIAIRALAKQNEEAKYAMAQIEKFARQTASPDAPAQSQGP